MAEGYRSGEGLGRMKVNRAGCSTGAGTDRDAGSLRPSARPSVGSREQCRHDDHTGCKGFSQPPRGESCTPCLRLNLPQERHRRASRHEHNGRDFEGLEAAFFFSRTTEEIPLGFFSPSGVMVKRSITNFCQKDDEVGYSPRSHLTPS